MMVLKMHNEPRLQSPPQLQVTFGNYTKR